MTKAKNPTLKDCNCLNCRLSRIEDQLNVLETLIQGMDLPVQSKKKSTIKSKKKS
jgi:hypothetical protein